MALQPTDNNTNVQMMIDPSKLDKNKDFNLNNYKFSIKNIFETEGEMATKVKFLQQQGNNLLLATFNFENVKTMENYLVLIIIDFKNKKIKASVPGVKTNFATNPFDSWKLPDLTAGTEYILKMTHDENSMNIFLMDSDETKELFKTNIITGVIQYFKDDKDDIVVSFGINAFNPLDILAYFNTKEKLTPDFYHIGTKIFDSDYLGMVSLDNRATQHTLNNFIDEGIKVEIVNGAEFVKVSEYGEAYALQQTSGSGSKDAIKILFDPSKFKVNGKYIMDEFYIMTPFYSIHPDGYQGNVRSSINGHAVNLNSNVPRSYFGYAVFKIDFLNSKISQMKYLNSTSINADTGFSIATTDVNAQDLIENKQNELKLTTRYYGGHPQTCQFLNIIFSKTEPKKFMINSLNNKVIPAIDSDTFNVPSKIISMVI